jgi:hypothetical protein
MATRFKAAWTALITVCIITAMSALWTVHTAAAGEQPPGPDRFAVVTQQYTAYEWWLTNWTDNQVACTILIDHEGLPTRAEIFSQCDKALFDKWIATVPCLPGNQCSGYYLQYIKTGPATRKVGVSLPPPVVWVSLDGCLPENATFRCDNLPVLLLTGEEPMSGQSILGLAGRVDGKPFTCDAVCQVDLAPTGSNGVLLEFWANSSYGDSSVVFTATVRVTPSDDPTSPTWNVDILTSQWRGEPLAPCSQIWGAFPPIGGVPYWLTTPANPDDLATDIPYEYLAANLISNHVVEASSCVDGGLLDDGTASQCGMEVARIAVTTWQNRYDSQILDAAVKVGIPARVIKSIFSRESQFWPGMIDGHPETGLGQLTNAGADTVLMWNQSFFEQFCSSRLDNSICGRGYAQLTSAQQDSLQNALVDSVNVTCDNCGLGIDLDRAQSSIEVFADTLLANCEQAGMVVHNTYGGAAGASVSYEDLWRYTLVNYHSGSGCLTLAIWETRRLGELPDWGHLSSHFTPACLGAIDYVSYVSAGSP